MEGFLDTLKISYSDNQKTTAPAVVFIHGFPFNRSTWDGQAALFSPKYRVITYDHRGHGQSPANPYPYLFESLVEDLFGLLDALEVQKATLCGLSMGGYVALRAAERAPERVERLVLCDTKSEADTDPARLNRAKDHAAILSKGLSAFAASFARKALGAQTIANNPSLVGRIETMIAANPVPGVLGALTAMATRTDTTPSLSNLKIPVHVIVGEEDVITPLSVAEALQSRIPGATLTRIPRAGHLSNLENPDAFNQALLQL